MFEQIMNMFQRKNQSKSLAKSRLHFVLVQDRSGLTNEELANFKKDLVSAIQKYFMIEDDSVAVDYQRANDSTTLVINSPVLRRKFAGKEGNKSNNKPANDLKIEQPEAVHS